MEKPQVTQEPDCELVFNIKLRGDDEYREVYRSLHEMYGQHPSPKMQKQRDRLSREFAWKYCRQSSVAIEAQELDPECVLHHYGGLTFSVHFINRGAAALFKLSYC